MARNYKKAEFFAKLITRKFEQNTALFTRMDEDYRRWRLEASGTDVTDPIRDKNRYVTNTLRTLADKISSYVAYAGRIISIPNANADEDRRKANNACEMLAIGLLEEADRRQQLSMGQPPVQSFLGWTSVIRGGWLGLRGMLIKDEAGETIPDVTPFDPRHFVVQLGSLGPLWCAHRIYKSRAEIWEEYPKFKFDDQEEKLARDEDDAQNEIEEVFDCYWRETEDDETRYFNAVMIDDRWARAPTRLFTVGFPVKVAPVGDTPLVAVGDTSPPSSIDTPIETVADFAESVFAPLRNVIDAKSRALSYRLELTSRAIERTWIVKSSDGSKTLASNPNLAGGEINLSTLNQEDIELADLAQLTRDADVLLDRLTDDETDGGLPPQAFGILPAPISSLALKQLGNNLEQKVTPRLRAVQVLLEAALEEMIAQFETESFKPVRVSGRTSRRRMFDQEISPKDIQGHGRLKVELVPVYPEEEAAKWQIAQYALAPTSTGESVGSLPWVRDNVIKMQDADQVSAENIRGLANLADPIARALQMYEASLKDGNMPQASIYFDEMHRLMIMKAVSTISAQLQLMQGQMVQAQAMSGGGAPMNGNGNGNGAAPAGPPGMTANVSPAAGQPGFTPQPSPEAGFNTTAPRVSEEQRLAAIGLERG